MNAPDAEKAHKQFQAMTRERDKETEPITILQWWAKKQNHLWVVGNNDGPPKEMRRLPASCGGCYWTNDRREEKTANALIIDNMYYLGRHSGWRHNKPKYKATTPNVGFIIVIILCDMIILNSFDWTRLNQIKNRNPNQYWIWYAREAASKAIDSGLAELGTLFDANFNLTLSYRRDSDIHHPMGSAETALLNARYKSVLNEDGSVHYEETESGEGWTGFDN